MTLAELYSSVEGMDFETRVDFARKNFGVLYAELLNEGLDMEGAIGLVNALIAVGVSADRTASMEEYELYNALFGIELTYEQFFERTNGGAAEVLVARIDQIVDHLDHEGKMAACSLALAFLSADGHVDYDEAALFERLLND